MSEQTAYLLVNDWHSTCSYCGGNAKSEPRHIHGGPESGGNMYAPAGSTLSDTNGCGARFVGKKPDRGASVATERALALEL